MGEIRDNVERVRERIAAAAIRSGRLAGEVQLVAVTKTVSPERVEEALAAGCVVLGESKVQEAKAKISIVSSRPRWHMVGHLQSNKARDAVAMFELIQSVDSVKLAAELSNCAERAGRTQPVLLEVNVGDEASKFGLKPDAVAEALAQINTLPRIEVQGLMTVAPFLPDPAQVRPYFRRLRELRDALKLRELSMGMTHDFETAIEEGATLVRIGTAIFGERQRHEPTE